MINNAAGLPPFEGPDHGNPDTGDAVQRHDSVPRGRGPPDATSDGGKLRAANGQPRTLAADVDREPELQGLRGLLVRRPADW